MNTSLLKATSRFSVNVPQAALLSENLVSLSDRQTRLEEIELTLEEIFGVENQLGMLQMIKVHNMQREIEKIKKKYKNKDAIMITLDAVRISHFQERIEAIYMETKPTKEALFYAEKLMQEQEELLALL